MRFWLAILGVFMCVPVFASYAERDEALEMVHELAQEHDYDEAYLQFLLGAIEKDEEVLRKISKPAEKTKQWFEYRPIFVESSRIENGVAFWQAHGETLKKAEKEFGVDADIIVAILGVETRYGKVMGKTPVLQALATLCFDYPQRAEFFCQQFDYFLRLSKAQDFDPLSIMGSYAGAMGMAQFMPSSYVDDAIDYDGDGRVDLWGSVEDAIGSIGNYLANRGWVSGGKLVESLPVQPSLPNFGQSHFPSIAVSDLLKDEAIIHEGSALEWLAMISEPQLGGLILQEEHESQWWLTYYNFGVLTRYNSSPLYAMAVIELADEISKQK